MPRELLSILVLASLLTSCGPSPAPERLSTDAPVSSLPENTIPDTTTEWGAGRITGKVNWHGDPPRRVALRVQADPFCQTQHQDNPLLSEEIVVNPNNTLRNVLIHITSGLEGKKFPPPSTPAVLDQIGCRYTPHILAIQTGQPLIIRNSDDTLHNVHAIAKSNPGFNIGQPTKGQETRRVFRNLELMIRFKCDVHPWMGAYLAVLDHPFHAVTGDDGVFSLDRLPPGTYTIESRHEKLGTQQQTITITGDETHTITFDFKPAL